MKKGFTLMEVLITVGIVGVVAAMTIPHMQSNVAKQQAGSGLMRAINTIENAFQLTMVNESIEKIPDFKNKTITEIFEEFVEPVMNGSKRHFDKFKYYSNFDKSITDDIQVTTDATIFTTKDGIQFFGPTSGAIGGCQGSKCVKNFYIDINGNATPPNAIGRDLFAMMLLEDGTVIAEGSIKDFMHYPIYSAKNYCNANEVKSGTYCGGAIVDNGGKVTYKW